MLGPMGRVLWSSIFKLWVEFCTILKGLSCSKAEQWSDSGVRGVFPLRWNRIWHSNPLFKRARCIQSRPNTDVQGIKLDQNSDPSYFQCVELYHGPLQSGGFYLEIGSRVIELERSYQSTEMELFYSTNDLVPLYQPVFKVSLVL